MLECDKYNNKIKQYKDDDLFIIFYNPDCPYCKNAFKYMEDKGFAYKGYIIDKYPDERDKLLECLMKDKENNGFRSDHTTVPIIFYKGKFVGGYTDLVAYRE